MFLKVKIPQSTAEMFKNLAVSVKNSLSVYDEKSVFEFSNNPKNVVINNNVSENQLLEFQVGNLIQLLEFSEQEMLRQAARFQRTIDKLQREIADRKNKEEALKASQELFTGIVNIPQDAIVPFEENQGIQRFNQGEEQI
jgi:PAS domain-containing protein